MPGGWPVGNCDYIANSAQLKLELGLSLAIVSFNFLISGQKARNPPAKPESSNKLAWGTISEISTPPRDKPLPHLHVHRLDRVGLPHDPPHPHCLGDVQPSKPWITNATMGFCFPGLFSSVPHSILLSELLCLLFQAQGASAGIRLQSF